MTAATTTMPRRPLAPWVPTVAVAILVVGLLAVSGARLTWDAPTVTIQAEQTVPEVSTASVDRATKLAAARYELTALRGAVRQVPALRASMHDHVRLLAAVSAGQVPIEALDRHNHPQLQQAVNAGHVPREALEPLQ